MCVIIIKQKSNKIPMLTLENASFVNPHGLGVVWLDTFKTEYFKSNEYNVLDTERPFIAHFRYATIGKINKANTHPFPCGEQADEMFMMNGTVRKYGNKDMTDTQHIANILGDKKRGEWKKFLSQFDCRFVSINTKIKSFQIFNRDLFTYKDGVWYSKTNIFRDNVVAVYGTLKHGYGNYNAYLKGQSIYMGGGETYSQFPLIINGLPYLSPKKGIGKNVVVDVFRVDDETFANLDRLEGHPRWYVREETDIVMEDGEVVSAWVYFNDIKTENLTHHKSYEPTPIGTFNFPEPLQPTVENECGGDCWEVIEDHTTEYEADSLCPTCYSDVEFDGFNNYLCINCDEWYAESDLQEILDTTNRVLKDTHYPNYE